MQLIKRIYQKYNTGGIKEIAASAKRRCYDPLFWAKLGLPSQYIAKYLKTMAPSILVLSHPRSGSSWVGDTLGNASNAVYLREPISQSYLKNGKYFICEVNPIQPDKLYKRFADFSFIGLPCFPDAPYVVKFHAQWELSKRKSRRLVIKEVNPLACEYFLKNYSPKVIFLVRHPAAVALSFRKFGWWNKIGKEEGKRLGIRLRAVYDSLKTYDECLIVKYEDLCTDPLSVFRNLFDFAGLEWNTKIEKLIQGNTSKGDTKKRYSISRDSKKMIRAWEGQLTEEELANLKEGYQVFDLPWYQSLDDW